MSIRANSLQSVVMDGVFYAALMGLGAAIMVTMARGAEPRSVTEAELIDRRLTDDHIDSQLNTDDNPASGDPTESPEAKREAMMLGMKLVERSEGNIHVDDVAATSPAWDAGIRRGDRLLSIDGIKPKSLSKWVEDLGSVLKDTPDGHAVATDVERDGEKLALRIRMPVSKAAAVRDARQEEQAIAQMAAENQQQQMPLAQQGGQTIVSGNEMGDAGYGRGNGGYAVGGWGLGGFFDDEDTNSNRNNTGDDRMANRAIAQLMAVNTVSGAGGANSLNGQAGQLNGMQSNNAQTSGGQVGVAAFQNTGQGVSAVVVVRGLPQGTYRVGIGQGDGMAGGFGANGMGNGAIDPNANFNGGQDPSQRGVQDRNSSNINGRNLNRGNDGRGGRVVPEPTQRNGAGLGQPPMNQSGPMPQGGGRSAQPAAAGGAAGGGTPAAGGAAAGGGAGASLASPHSVGILAQRLDPQQMQANGSGNSGVAPGTNQRNQTGQGNQPIQNPNPGAAAGNIPNNQNGNGNQSGTGNGNRNGTRDNINPANANNNIRPTPVGILRVGADGSGRLETQLDGVQVRSLVGMSVSVFSEMAQGGGLAGNNQQGFGGANQNAGQNAQQQRQNNNAAAARGGQNGAGPMPGNNMQPNQAPGALNGGSGQGVVATGVVQIMEGNGQQGVGQQGQGGNLFPGQQNDPNQAAEAARNQGQISDPQENFDPSQVQ